MEQKIKLCALTTISKTMDWFIVDSMRNLAKNGYDITLVSNMASGFVERNNDYADCIHLPMSRGASLKDFLVMPFKLYRIFKRGNFDVVYYTSPNASLYASLAAKLAGVPCRLYSQCGLRYVGLEGRKRKVFKYIEKLTCSFSTTVRAQSFKNRAYAVSEGLVSDRKISVVGIGGTTGVDLSMCDSIDKIGERRRFRAKYNIPNDSFVYGYVGRINADKGINELIEAFSTLDKSIDNAYLVLVGMIDKVNPIKAKMMETANKHPRIIMTGNVAPNEVYFYMTMFDVLVHPTYREGFGKVLQEAMGMSLPIITTNVPGPSEVVEDGISGVLVKVADSRDLQIQMLQIFKNNDLREKLSKGGRLRAEKYFNRPIMLQNILSDLNKTLQNDKTLQNGK